MRHLLLKRFVKKHAGFSVGQRVYTRKPTMGETDNGDEVTYPAGTPALIDAIERFDGPQGIGITVVIGEITNVFDESDGPYADFLSIKPPAVA